MTDAPGRWVGASTLWAASAVGATLAGAGYPPAYVSAVLPVVLGLGLLRMAAQAVREQRPGIPDLLRPARHRVRRNLLLTLAHLALLATALLNIGTGLAAEGLLATMVVVLACYVAVATCVVALVAWPVLLDPSRDVLPVRAALRVALTAVALRPVGVLVLALVTAALAVVTVQTLVAGVVLPAFGALLVAHYVLPLADRVLPPSAPADDRDR